MSSKMEVDSNKPNGGCEEKVLDVHPLAIVHMSDQYTRITCGGSPLDTNTPVVGLLFGTVSNEKEEFRSLQGSNIEEQQKTTTKQKVRIDIRDADDIPILPHGIIEQTKQQIELHTAVFPNNKVIGWYRVDMIKNNNNNNNISSQDSSSNSASVLTPTADDLKLTQLLQEQLSSMDDVPSLKDELCFALLQIPSDNNTNNKGNSDNGNTSSSSTDPLPLTVYDVRNINNTPILVELDQWSLETSEPERIAVERVVQEQPHDYLLSTTTTTTTTSSTGDNDGDKKQSAATKGGGSSTETTTTTTTTAKPSRYVTNLIPLQNSLDSMNDRLDILIQYIQATINGDVPTNLELLREVQGLVYQLGPLYATSSTSAARRSNSSMSSSSNSAVDDSVLVSHLAAIAKTVCAVQQYTDKFSLVYGQQQGGGSGSSGMSSARRYRE